MRRVAAGLLAMGLLPACGGGSGGGGGGPPPAWGTPLLMEAVGGLIPEFDLSGDAAGNLFLAWPQYDGVRQNLWSRRYSDAGGWAAAELVETNSGDARLPRLTTRPSGETWVVWLQPVASNDQVWASRALSPAGWTAPVMISAGVHDAGAPVAASDDAGNVWVVWDQLDPAIPQRSLWSARYSTAGGWTSSAQLSAGQGVGDYLPDVAAGSTSGAAVAVWQENDGTNINIRAARYTAGVGWSGPQTIDARTSSGTDAKVAMDAAGNALALWGQPGDLVADDLFSARAPAGGAWEAPVRVDNDLGGSKLPQLAMNAAGTAFAIWREALGPDSVWAARYTPAGGWEASASVETETVQVTWPTDVAVNAAGQAAVVWHQVVAGGNVDIWCAFYRGGWVPPERVEFSAGTGDTLPRVTLDDAGRAATGWTEPLVPGAGNLWTNLFR